MWRGGTTEYKVACGMAQQECEKRAGDSCLYFIVRMLTRFNGESGVGFHEEAVGVFGRASVLVHDSYAELDDEGERQGVDGGGRRWVRGFLVVVF